MATDEAGWAGQDDGQSCEPEVVGTNDCFATSHPLLLESLCCLAARQDVVEADHSCRDQEPKPITVIPFPFQGQG